MVKSISASELIEQMRSDGTFVETLSVRAIWGPRAEVPEAIAARLLRTIEGLAQLGVAVGQPWWAHEQPLPLDVAGLARLLEGGVVRRDSDNTVMEGTGYHQSYYSGARRRPRGAALSVNAGATSPSGNVVVLKPASPNYEDDRAAFLANAAGLTTLMAEAWQPDWVVFSRSDLSDKVNGLPGAVTWVADRVGDVPEQLVPGAAARQVAGGTLIDLMHEARLPTAEVLLSLRDRLLDLGLVEPGVG